MVLGNGTETGVGDSDTQHTAPTSRSYEGRCKMPSGPIPSDLGVECLTGPRPHFHTEGLRWGQEGPTLTSGDW